MCAQCDAKKHTELYTILADIVITGDFFGYPRCCSKDFALVMLTGAVTKSPYQSAVGEGTGFIPCNYHSILILEKIITLESLITNRVCKLPFPRQQQAKTVQKYINGRFEGLDVKKFVEEIFHQKIPQIK